MREEKWKVIWSQNKPIIIFQGPIFKYYKVKNWEEIEIYPEKAKELESYQSMRNQFCDDPDIDGLACDELRAYFRDWVKKWE